MTHPGTYGNILYHATHARSTQLKLRRWNGCIRHTYAPPRWLMWTRIWCVRPVLMSQATRVCPGLPGGQRVGSTAASGQLRHRTTHACVCIDHVRAQDEDLHRSHKPRRDLVFKRAPSPNHVVCVVSGPPTLQDAPRPKTRWHAGLHKRNAASAAARGAAAAKGGDHLGRCLVLAGDFRKWACRLFGGWESSLETPWLAQGHRGLYLGCEGPR